MADDIAQREKGTPVWLDMDQKALDEAYDQAVWAPNQSLVHRRRDAASAEAYARLKPRRIAYGATPVEGFDFYSCGRVGAPILVYTHGGAWRSGTARDFAHLAEPYLDIGAHVAILDFTSIDDVDGELPVMVDQVRRAVAQISRTAGELGGDANKIFVAGHSSGGHLTGCLVVTDWENLFGLSGNVLAGAVLMSGMYELEPVRRSKRSLYVKFTDANVAALSAIRHLDKVRCPIIVAYGTQETPEFQRQSREFHAALEKAGKPAELIVVEAANHFEIQEAFHNPYGPIGRHALAQVRAVI